MSFLFEFLILKHTAEAEMTIRLALGSFQHLYEFEGEMPLEVNYGN